ncbi:MAG TPA: cobalamin biosynthesis protein [Candidatus Methanoperedenaceae archaeon]|nr:cobalamin biosynthesis protein [Candidatus Methanoperedenaceae archaeon]
MGHRDEAALMIEVLLLAIAIDLLIGEPPAAIHPVVWMGRLISFLYRCAPKGKRRLYGALMAVSCITASALIGIASAYFADTVPGMLVSAFLLKSTFSIRMLLGTAGSIGRELEAGKIEAARKSLLALVGRDTSNLDTSLASSAVIESTAENFVDGILSPLFYFVLLGLPGALAFRAVNTLDSMVGYRREPFREIGYASAKLDDAANFIPGRLSLLFIALASASGGALRTGLRDHALSPSPNSGWSMSAMAGALGVRLEKVGYYVLGAGYREPVPKDIKRAVTTTGLASAAAVASVIAAALPPTHSILTGYVQVMP